MINQFTENLSRRVVLGILLGGLLLFAYAVLHSFLVPVAWAVILAYATWPLHAHMRRLCRGRNALAALGSTLLLSSAFIIPTILFALALRRELSGMYTAVSDLLAQGSASLPEALTSMPVVGDLLVEFFDSFSTDPQIIYSQISKWAEESGTRLLNILGGVGRNAAKLGFALVTVFFLYRDGDRILEQSRLVLWRFIGPRVNPYLSAIGNMTMAVVWGLLATALAQGFVAGLGYWACGLGAPALLGILTVIIAMIPFGAPVVWGSVGVWLLLNGQIAEGIGLLLWGALVVSWIDNLIRPIVISNATRIPFLLVMFGVLGGLAAFGLIGLFVGPVILAVLMAVWKEWLEESPLQLKSKPAQEADAKT